MDKEMNEQIEKTLNKLYQNKDKTIMVGELYDEPIFYSNAVRTLDNVLYEEGLITVDNEARRLTSLGLKICASGGWIEYQNQYRHRQQLEEARQQKSDEKLNYELRMSKYLYKTRWWPLAISLISLGIALWSLFSGKE